MKCIQNTEEQRVVVSVPEIWKKIGEEIQRIQQVRRCRFRSSVSKCGESSTLKSVCSNTVEYGVSNSTLEFERLRKQVKIAERLTKGTLSNTQVRYVVMNSQKAPQTVEVSQQQYTGMNVDVLVIWRHTDGAGSRTGPSLMYEREVSTIRGVQESVLRQGERCERSEENTVKGAQWKDRCRGLRRYS